jgi:hypothetical protein
MYIKELGLYAPSFNSKNKIELKPITFLIRHKGKKIYEVKTNSNKQIAVTGDHSLFTLNEYWSVEKIKVDTLKNNDFIVIPKKIPFFDIENKYSDLISIGDLCLERIKNINIREDIPQYVYDISVEDNENFMGGNNGLICLHNTAGRIAKLDKKKYGEKAYIKENEFGEYYTNSIHLATDSDVDYITRIIEQSKFHPLVEAGSMIHIWSGDKKPSPQAIYGLVKSTWDNTECSQIVVSPEYTVCYDCNNIFSGLHNDCPKCSNSNVRQYTRITGYLVEVNRFNPSKKAELKDRKRELIMEDINENLH